MRSHTQWGWLVDSIERIFQGVEDGLPGEEDGVSFEGRLGGLCLKGRIVGIVKQIPHRIIKRRIMEI